VNAGIDSAQVFGVFWVGFPPTMVNMKQEVMAADGLVDLVDCESILLFDLPFSFGSFDLVVSYPIFSK
jgi:hypothetical protein